jgi:RNA polymerase sigma factor (sigma-70 family)
MDSASAASLPVERPLKCGSASATDAELIDASRRGERLAFGTLVERYATMVTAVSYAGVRDRALGEDIAQDTFVAAWRELDRLRDSAAVKPWLCGIARNLARKARRRRGREVADAEADGVVERTPFDVLHDEQAERLVAAALARVPEAYREVLVMFYYEQRSAKDVGEALGIGEQAVHKRLSRGRKYLAEGLEDSVERVLASRRTRRDFAGCVLAALPIGSVVVPDHVQPEGAPSAPATKGWNMWKLGLIGAAALVMTTVGAVVTLAHRDAHSAGADVSVQHDGRERRMGGTGHPIAAPSLPTLTAPAASAPMSGGGAATTAASADCDNVARHWAEVIMESGRRVVSGEAATAMAQPWLTDMMASQLAQKCRDAGWSPTTIACVMSSHDMWNVMLCQQPPPAVPATAHAAAGTDISCAAVAARMGALAIADVETFIPVDMLNALDGDRSAAAKGVTKMTETQCVDQHWSEDQRACAIAAPTTQALYTCGQAPAPAPPVPVAASVDASCEAVGQHVAWLPSQARGSVGSTTGEKPGDLAPQIAAACVDGAWTDAMRRCMLGTTEAGQFSACHR